MFGTAEREVANAILEQLKYIAAHTSRTSELLSTGVINGVLEAATWTFGTDGRLMRQWGATAGTVQVTNLGTGDVVLAAGAVATAPNGGNACTIIPAGTVGTFSVASRVVTLFGTAGERVVLQAFTGAMLPGGGFVGVDGGAP